MPNYAPYVIFVLLSIALALWVWLDATSTQKLRESLFRNEGLPLRNFIGMCLGSTASLLPLASGTWTISLAAWTFVSAVALTVVILVVVSPNRKWATGQFAWGLPVMIVLGFGLGALIYQTRSWWIWFWRQILRIDQTYEWALVALFLIGTILGVFVVRNWAKEQKAFVESLSGILGGTFVAAVFVKMFEDVPQMSQRAFTVYALGFAISGTINLIVAARLTAQYTNRQSLVSRSILDFLYGSERAEIIDKYFLKNFEEDPDYAKRWLTNTLSEFCELVQREFAERMEIRRQLRQKERPKWRYYELIAIKDKPARERTDQSEHPGKERKHTVLYRRLVEPPRSAVGEREALSPAAVIRQQMFRVGVSIKNADHLEYIVAPGEFHAPFPLLKSVAGLALEMRQTVVMDRDMDRKFRNKDHKDGISPRELEQPRGLDEIDFLSYISVPVVSRLGEATENALGIVHLDTKIFVSHGKLPDEPDEPDEEVLSTQMTLKELHERARQLFDENDEYIHYCEDLTKVIRPVLELYARCGVGAT